MPLEVITTRYGAAAIDALERAVAAAKAGEPLRAVTVVVPSNYAGVAARRALARRRGVANVGFVTLYRLAELLAGPTLARAGRLPLSSPVLATALRASLAAQPGLFAPVADQPSTVEALRRVHRELRDLTAPQLDELAATGARAAAVVELDRRVTAGLAPAWFDETDLMLTGIARVRAATVDDVGGPVGPVVLHLPQRLTAFGAQLVRALAERGPVAVVIGLCDEAAADRTPGRLLARLGLEPDAVPAPGPHPATRVVEQVVAADEDDEVRTAVRRVMAAAAAGLPLERVLIVYGPNATYGRLLADHLNAAGVPWNGVADVPLAERVAGRTLLGLLALDGTLRRHEVFALLASSPARSDRPIAAWERLSREAGIVAGPDQWASRLGALVELRRVQAALSASDDPWQADQAARAEGLAAFIATLAEHLQPPDGATWSAHARWARDLLTLVVGGPARRAAWSHDELRAAERVEATIDRLGHLDAVPPPGANGVDAARPVVTRAVFHAALEAELADGLTTLGRLGEGAFIGPVPMAVGIDADLVIVLGLIEGALPGGLGDDPLLAEHSRRALDGALATALDRRESLHHQVLAVVDAAGEVVVASRPQADLRQGTARFASRWLEPILQRGARGPSHRHRGFHTGLHDALPPASEQEALLADLDVLAQSGHPLSAHPAAHADAPLSHVLALLSARASAEFTAWDGNLAAVAAAGAELLPSRAAATTALEAWATCPFGYFARHVLGVRPVENPEEALTLRAVDRGNLVHDVLDAALRWCIEAADVPPPTGPWSAAARAKLDDELARACAAAEARGVVGQPLHWRLEQRRLRRRLAYFLELDAIARAANGTQPIRTEMPFGGDEDGFALALPNGKQLQLVGKVDRVDAGPGRVVVVDYKTGKARAGAGDDPFDGGRRLQLPIYGLVANQRYGSATTTVSAEYWYIHDETSGQGRGVVEVDAPTVTRLSSLLALITDGISHGLFIAHPDEPQPWRRWVSCPYCDPDGSDTTSLWEQWRRKQHDPAVAPYLALAAEEDDPDGDGEAGASVGMDR